QREHHPDGRGMHGARKGQSHRVPPVCHIRSRLRSADVLSTSLRMLMSPRSGAGAAMLIGLFWAAPACAQPPAGPVAALPPVPVPAPPPVASSSEQIIPGKAFELRPQGRPADVLRLVPGLIINQHQGGGKAEQYLIRGFDADHGTDLAIFVDGVP